MQSFSVQAKRNDDLVDLSAEHIAMLGWLADKSKQGGSSAQRQELFTAFDNSVNPEALLTELQRIGCVSCDQQRVILTDQLIDLPVIGQVAAGTPIEAVENHAMQLCLPLSLFQEKPTYLLKVRGNSMQDIGILDGDLIAVRKTQQSAQGKVVVARVDNEVTVKRLQFEKGANKVALLPENADYEPILVSAEDLVIEGEFVGVIRPKRTLH